MADGYVATPIPPFATAIGQSYNTFTTNQDVSPALVPVILGNQLRVGSRIKIEAQGEFSTTGTPTIQLGFYLGLPGASGKPAALTTILAQSTTITTGSAAAAWPWRMEWLGLVVTQGTSGSIVGQGDLELGTSLTAFSANAIPATAAARTVTRDTTIASAIGICGAWSASSASNIIIPHYLNALLLN